MTLTSAVADTQNIATKNRRIDYKSSKKIAESIIKVAKKSQKIKKIAKNKKSQK
jgi:hypothetical protein